MVVFLALKILQKKKLLNKVIFWDYMSKTRIEVLIYTTSRKAISLPTHTWFVWFITKLNQVKEKGQNTSIYSKMLVLTNYLRWLNSTKWRPSYFLFITFDNSQFSSLPIFFGKVINGNELNKPNLVSSSTAVSSPLLCCLHIELVTTVP
jgi:hypothetical protein